MPKLLLSAFSCGPNQGSEPGVGWSTVLALANDPANELWVFVEPSWEEKIQAHLQQHPLPRVHFIFAGSRKLSRVMCSLLTQSISWNLYYYLWQLSLMPTLRKHHEEYRFDLAMHVTYVNLKVPSMLGALGIPFVWGPVGGAETAPDCFFDEMHWKMRAFEALRNLMISLARFNPLVFNTARCSTLAFGVTRESEDALRSFGAKNVELMPAVALSDTDFSLLTPPKKGKSESNHLHLLYVGNLIPYKGVHLAIRALAAANSFAQIDLTIVGDGPLRGWLEQIVHDNGLAARVKFLGKQPREVVLRAYAEADGLLFPSLHDSGGYAVLEAMAAGLPVICLDYGGPSVFVDDTCGWKVSAQTPAEAVEGLAAAILEFATEPLVRQKRATKARERVLQNHTWNQQGKKLREWICRVLAATEGAKL